MGRGLILGIAALVALSGRESEPMVTVPTIPPDDSEPRRASLEGWLARSGIPAPWQQFLFFVAAGESNFNLMVKPNTSPAEAKAAKIAYDRNAAKLSACGHPESDYTFGSGGWFGFLAPYVPMNLPDALRCVNPIEAMQSPVLSITAAVNFGRYLWNRAAYDTVATIRSGWGWPAKINDAARLAERRPAYLARARKLGWPESYVDTVLPHMDLSPEQVYANLTAPTAAA